MERAHPEVMLRRVRANGLEFSVREWGRRGAPMVVCMPGTGLSAALFAGVEARLSSRWHGFSIDRRGTGLSDKPETGYDFQDFAGDLVALADALGVRDSLALGHSAGGSDVLLAAGIDPRPWRAIIAIEPTLQDPRRRPAAPYDPAEWEETYERTLRRRAVFPSLEAAFERYRQAPIYARAEPQALRDYLQHAFETRGDGSASLRCQPRYEGQMNAFISLVMQGQHRLPGRTSDTFEPLLGLALPTLLVSTGQSGEQYRRMVQLGLEVIPHARHEHYEDAGHLLPLDHPDIVAALAERMRETG